VRDALSSSAVISFPGEGERLPPTARFRFKVARTELAVLEFEIEPSFGTSLHVHKRHNDSYFMLAGELEFRLGADTIRATEGTSVLVPPGVEHRWSNSGPGHARFLNIHAPGDWFEAYIRERAALELAGQEPDRAFFERHDIFVV
jgi:quercetin dioxygenase-like cupin family protein